MHGLGNDFVLINCINQIIQLPLPVELIKSLSDRHRGIGFDQLLLLESSNEQNVDFKYSIFNADGSESGQCGNGARCIAVFLKEHRMLNSNNIRLATNKGIFDINIIGNQIRVNMGIPCFDPFKIPFLALRKSKNYLISIGDSCIDIGVLSLGNPHVVLLVDNIKTAPVQYLGSLLEKHYCFLEKTNVSFMQVLSPTYVRLRVFERGVGETLACGSAACAATIIGQLWGILHKNVYVELEGGQLVINWQGENHPVIMTGPACMVFEGQINLDNISSIKK